MTWIDDHEQLARQAWRARARADAAAARYGDLDDCAAGLRVLAAFASRSGSAEARAAVDATKAVYDAEAAALSGAVSEAERLERTLRARAAAWADTLPPALRMSARTAFDGNGERDEDEYIQGCRDFARSLVLPEARDGRA